MAAWAYMLGGLFVWAAHFAGVYAIASVADLVQSAEARPARLAIGAFTLLCIVTNAGLLALALRRFRRQDDQTTRFIDAAAALAAGVSLGAVVWQGLPALVGG